MVKLPFLDENHRMATFGELVADHPTAGAGSHHHHVPFDVATGPSRGGVHLLHPTRLGDLRRSLGLGAHGALHLRPVKMHRLVEERNHGERQPQHRVFLPETSKLFLLRRRQRLKGPPGAQPRRRVQGTLGGPPGPAQLR